VTSFLDTSMVVRYLTRDDPELAAQAARIIDRGDPLAVTDVVVVEAAYVLSSVYAVPRERLVDSLIDFLQKENIGFSGFDKGWALQGLLLCRPSNRVSFADAMIWAAARSMGITTMYALDQRFPKEGLDVRRDA